MSKKLLIYNPISNAGHLDSWSAVFLEEIVKKKQEAIYVGEDIEIIKKNIGNSKILSKIKFVKIYNINEKIKLKLKSFFFKTLNFFFSFIFNKTLHLNYFLSPVNFYSNCNQIIKKLNINNNDILVVNMFLDIYQINEAQWIKSDNKYSFPWCGLHFHDVKSRIDILNKLKNNIFLVFMVKNLIKKYKYKKNFYLPEFTFSKTEIHNFNLKKKILKFKKKRKIIFMGGAIGKRKNLSNWYKLINLVNNKKYYFIQIGKVFFSDLDYDDKISFKKLKKKHPKDIFIYNKFLPNEKNLNSLISLSDIIYAVYKNFNSSSNMISKSLALKKPILVSRGGKMEADVKKYNIGEIIEYNDLKNTISAIDKILLKKVNYSFNYDIEYRKFQKKFMNIFFN